MRIATRIRAGRAIFGLALAALLASAAPALAHGTGSNWVEGGAAPLAVHFYYSTGDPMAWVGVKVFGPGDTSMEYQDARTDKAGVIAFVPDRQGPWRVEAQDDQGHRAVAETTVGADMVRKAGAAQASGSGSPARSAALGLSVLLNIFLGLALWRSGRKAAPKV